MNTIEQTAFIERVQALYPRRHNDEQLKSLVKFLRGYPAEDVTAALDHHIQTDARTPQVAHLIAILRARGAARVKKREAPGSWPAQIRKEWADRGFKVPQDITDEETIVRFYRTHRLNAGIVDLEAFENQVEAALRFHTSLSDEARPAWVEAVFIDSADELKVRLAELAGQDPY